MLNETDIDLEDLEARLYGQIYHSFINDELVANQSMMSQVRQPPLLLSNSLETNTLPNIADRNFIGRYFNDRSYIYQNLPQEPIYIPNNREIHVPMENILDNIQISDQHSGTMNVFHSNFNHIVPPPVVNPTVSNIVVMPTSPTPMFSTSVNSPTKSKRQLKRERKRARMLLEKQMSNCNIQQYETIMNYVPGKFREHRMTKEPKSRIVNVFGINVEEITLTSESEHSDCECVEEVKEDVALIVVSSDEECDEKLNESKEESADCNKSTENIQENTEINVSNSTSENNETEVTQDQVNSSTNSPKMSTDTVKSEKNSQEMLAVNNINSDTNDEVVFVEPEPKVPEVIVIDCDLETSEVINIDSKIIADADANACMNTKHNNDKIISTHSSPSSTDNQRNQKNKSATHQQNSESLATSESAASNDFLDNTFENSRDNFNFGLHGTDFTYSRDISKSTTTTNADIYETESSCSASDMSTPIKNAIFNEAEFESPGNEIFADMNLENFGSYITPKRKLPIVTLKRANTSSPKTNTKKNKKARKETPKNNSDSSSESDYDNKVVQITSKKKTMSKKHKLPDLSPMPSDEELNEAKKKKIVDENDDVNNSEIEPQQSTNKKSSGHTWPLHSNMTSYVRNSAPRVANLTPAGACIPAISLLSAHDTII